MKYAKELEQRELQKRHGKQTLAKNVKRMSPKPAPKQKGSGRPRGRPPKKQDPTSPTEPKRPRGRPRKEHVVLGFVATNSKYTDNYAIWTASHDEADTTQGWFSLKRKASDNVSEVPRKRGRPSKGQEKQEKALDISGIISESEWSRITQSSVLSEGEDEEVIGSDGETERDSQNGGEIEKSSENYGEMEKSRENYGEMEKSSENYGEIDKNSETYGETEKNREIDDNEGSVSSLEFDAVSQESEDSLDPELMTTEQKFDAMMRKEESKSPKKSVTGPKDKVKVSKAGREKISDGRNNKQDSVPDHVWDKIVGKAPNTQGESGNSNLRNSVSAEQKFDAMMRKEDLKSPKKSLTVPKDNVTNSKPGCSKPTRRNGRNNSRRINSEEDPLSEDSVDDVVSNPRKTRASKHVLDSELKTAEQKFDAMMRKEELKSPKKSETVPKVKLGVSKDGSWRISDEAKSKQDSVPGDVWDKIVGKTPNPHVEIRNVNLGNSKTQKKVAQSKSTETPSSVSDVFDDWDRIRALKPPERKFISTSPK